MEKKVFVKNYNAPAVNKKEALRYCGADESDEMLSLLDGCIDEAEGLLTYRLCYAEYGIDVLGEEIDLGFCKTRSHSLTLCLKDCTHVVVFGATIGAGIDRLINKYSVLSPSRAVMLQALGSERVEALCDAFCEDLARENDIRPRFSPGYGDLSLDVQRNIFDALDLTRKIGINLNDNLFMTPSKSVTAIVGIKKG